MTLVSVETALAAAALTLACWARGRRPAPLGGAVLLLALLEPVAAFTLFNVGLGMTSTSHAGLLLGLESIFAVTLLAVATRTVPPPQVLAGIGFGVAGVVVLTGAPILGAPVVGGWGDVLVLADSFVAAAYLVLVSRLAPRSDPLGLTATQFLLATPLTLALAVAGLLGGTERLPSAVPLDSAAAVAATSLLGVAGPFALYTWGLQRISATTAAALIPITPVAATLFAATFGGESLTPRVLGALALISVSLLAVSRVPGTTRPDGTVTR